MLFRTTILFFVSRICQYVLVFLSPIDQFDTSTDLTLQKLLPAAYLSSRSEFWNRHLWNKLLSWDAVYFIKGMLSKDGIPEFEHEYAFSSPLWIYTVRFFARSDDLYRVLKVGVLVENIIFYLASIILYHLTFRTFSHNGQGSHYARKIAEKTVTLFIFTSAAGFLTGIYSEPLSFALSFLGMLFRENAVSILVPFHIDFQWSKWPLYILSVACFSLATVTRSNCIFVGIYYIFDLLQLIRVRKYSKAFWFPFLSGFTMFMACIYHYYYLPYKIFCPERGEWCQTQLLNGFPITKTMFYNYIQSHYWRVGFLNYWSVNNIPNFLFALPSVIILLYSTVYFSKIYPLYNLKPLIWITQALVIMVLLFAHVQILNRISPFIPIHLWYISDRLLKTSTKKGNNASVGDDKIVRAYIYWLIFWIPLQTVLFASFLPPA